MPTAQYFSGDVIANVLNGAIANTNVNANPCIKYKL
jgi:hypothetical protein